MLKSIDRSWLLISFCVRRSTSAILLCLLLFLLSYPAIVCSEQPAAAQAVDKLDCSSQGIHEQPVVRFGILYREGTKGGQLQLEGIEEALREHEKKRRLDSSLTPVCRIRFPYHTESSGYERLKEIGKQTQNKDKEAVHVVFGPTDSGVMLDAVRNQDYFSNARLPVISSIVAAKIELNKDSWLFSTNLNQSARIARIRVFLRREGIDTIGVLYQDSEYGRQAEKILHASISSTLTGSKQAGDYQAVRFNTQEELSLGIDQLISKRPAAIGIFASRDWIRRFLKAFRFQNHSINPYSPLLFTTIDVRSLQDEQLRFVSVDTGSEKEHEVKALAYDTTSLALELIDTAVATRPNLRDQWADSFNNAFQGLMKGSSLKGEKTGSYFDTGSNLLEPSVMIFDRNKRLTTLTPEGRVFEGARKYVENLYRRYGYVPVLNLVVIAVLVWWLSRHDLARWNEEKDISDDVKKETNKLIAFNVTVALIVYVSLVITEAFSWGDISAAFVIGVGYPALLKSTFGKTQLGRTVGLSEYYDYYLYRIYDRIMETKYRDRRETVDVIAFTNSIPKLEEELLNIYRFNSPRRRKDLTGKLEEELAVAKGLIEKRLVYAKKIRRYLEWDELRKKGLVPNVNSEEMLISPIRMLDVGVEYLWMSGKNSSGDLKKDVDEYLKELKTSSAERAEEVKNEMDEWISQTIGERGRIRCYLRVLYMRDQYDIGKITKDGEYLPKEAAENTDKKEWWENYQWKNSGQQIEPEGEIAKEVS